MRRTGRNTVRRTSLAGAAARAPGTGHHMPIYTLFIDWLAVPVHGSAHAHAPEVRESTRRRATGMYTCWSIHEVLYCLFYVVINVIFKHTNAYRFKGRSKIRICLFSTDKCNVKLYSSIIMLYARVAVVARSSKTNRGWSYIVLLCLLNSQMLFINLKSVFLWNAITYLVSCPVSCHP